MGINLNNIKAGEIDTNIRAMTKTMMALMNHMNTLQKPNLMKSHERAEARKHYVKQQSDLIVGEMLLSGLFGGAVPGIDMIIGMDNWTDVFMEMGEDLYELNAWRELTVEEKTLIKMRLRIYKEELSARKRVNNQKRRLDKRYSELAMAVHHLQKRAQRRDAAERKRAQTFAFVQNQHSMKNCKTGRYHISLKQQKQALFALKQEKDQPEAA